MIVAAHASIAAAQPGADVEPDTSIYAGSPPENTVGIRLEQAQTLAANNSPLVRRTAAGVEAALGSRMREAGVFDPVLAGSSERAVSSFPSTGPFSATETQIRSLIGGLSWLSPIGTSLEATFTRITTETDAPFSTLPRAREATAGFRFVQPLLKGFGTAATRGELRATSREVEAADAIYEQARRDVEADVELAYWELYAAERDLELVRAQRQRAAVFMRDQRLRGRAGVVGPSAVAIARTFLAQQQALLIEARVRLGITADRLAEVIGVDVDPAGRFSALDEPPPPDPVEPLEAVLARAHEVNPLVLAAEREVDAADARARAAIRNAWPSVDAFGGYGGYGLAGTGRTIDFGGSPVGSDFDTDFDEAWDQVFGDDYPQWNFGLRVHVPIGWRSDRGERQRLVAERERARENLRAARLALDNAVRRAHRENQLSQEALVAMRELVLSAEEQARVARLEYQAGRTTAYELVNIETDLTAATFRENEVRVRVSRANAELRRLTAPSPEGPNR